MRSARRPSDVHGPPADRPRTHAIPPEPPAGVRSRPLRWLAVPLLGVLAVVGVALFAAPDEVGVGGIPPAEVRIVDEGHALAALALHRAQADAQAALAHDAGPGAPGRLVLEEFSTAQAEVYRRLAEARALPGADASVRSYWASSDHDLHAARLEDIRRAAEEISLLAATHDTLYAGTDAVELRSAEVELAARYLTGVTGAADAREEWGRALLAELEGSGEREAAEHARSATDRWWQDRVAELDPPATEPLRAYLGGLPEEALVDLERHPLAGPELARLREG